MNTYEKYIINISATIFDALVALDKLTADILTLFVVDNNYKLKGTVTDGDIRRALLKGITLDDSITTVMNKNFHYFTAANINVNLVKKCRYNKIWLLPYLSDDGVLQKVFNLQNQISILPVDAVLMAGGKGERLRPLTETTPKPLLPIGDKCIIDYNVDRLINYGISNIFVTINYLKEQIENHFSTPRNDVEIKCIREPYYLGTIGSVKFINHFRNDSILIMNSDLFTNINFEEFYLHFIDNNADMSVATIPYSVSIPYGIFKFENQSIKITGIEEKPKYNYYANSGIYLIKRSILNLIPDDIFFDATDLIGVLISKGYSVIRFPIVGYWIDIGKYEDYNKAQDFVKYI
ncbi:MAG: nucleotidyltransferase family protein [Candidatus Azobacteroides sp.]|nr:nucleotidyltransferase family protein [Candidatus Azobacteroides sp.]